MIGGAPLFLAVVCLLPAACDLGPRDDLTRFRDDYESRRISITMSYGRRRDPVSEPV